VLDIASFDNGQNERQWSFSIKKDLMEVSLDTRRILPAEVSTKV
jgi:hypothetical protein